MCSQGTESCRSDTPAGAGAADCRPIMESSAASSPVAPDDAPRVKFLCSFGGSILPRPLDGRLRYVGGETRIVSVPRDVSYDDLLARMQELFEGPSVIIKYQQPDEDLDALVSVVNDDDVMNMMEEYDKLGATGDGFTRLRIFLFPQQHLEHDASADATAHFDSDDRGTERRYVDALNSVTDTKSSSLLDASDQFSGPPGIDCGIHNQISPHPSHGQRYGDMDATWSPSYYSPGHHPAHDPREFPPSPSARYHLATGELNDRISLEEYIRQSPVHQPAQHDHQSPPYTENLLWLPPGAIVQEKAGFPSNIGHAHNVFDGSTICEHCRMAFQRSQAAVSDPRYLEPRWKHGQPPHMEANTANDFMGYFSNSCADCYRKPDVKLDHGVYVKEQSEHHRPFYNEAQGHDWGWALHHHQASNLLDDPRVHLTGSGRMGEHYIVDGNAVNVPITHGNFYEGHSVPSRPSTELGNEVFHAQQTVGGGPNTQILFPSTYGTDNLYQVPLNLPPIQSLRRKAQVPIRAGPLYDSSGLMMPNGGTNPGFVRSPQDGSPRFSRIAVENQIQNSWAGQNGHTPQKIPGFDGSAAPEYIYDHVPRVNQNMIGQNGNTPQKIPGFDGSAAPEYLYDHVPRVNQNMIGQDGRISIVPDPIQCQPRILHVENPYDALPPAPTLVDDKLVDSNKLNPTIEECNTAKFVESDAHAAADVESLSFLPELIASVKKAKLASAEVVKARVEANVDENISSVPEKESSLHELEPENDSDGDADHRKTSKIESTTAEAEALDKGLQTIRNDDLEEIRELGSGTYGSVFHGKWKGSDVAIKRIKASCFAGRPSERERLIADFWKEALILSSLHHPNVVSFYGVVRDGPDGSLATVTEFMVNGSLKQFLQKKDRTIDRRKRLIIAMDAAFGMEYLHGKNIVHFDLKCENLLVNMRDPHRPVCKIGDLGLSKVKQHTLVSGGVRGTLPWMAPELLSGKCNMVTEKIDVYSFGIVMWELLTGEEPYADMHCASVIGGIVNNTLRPQIPTWCDPEWKSLMESCWSSDPGERPSFSEISQKLRKMSAAMNVK